MQCTLPSFDEMLTKFSARLVRSRTEVLQVNVTNTCNQECNHCYVDAGPYRTDTMDLNTLSACLEFLRLSKVERVEITGGAPELYPNFEELIKSISRIKKKIVVRSNLTVLLEPGKEHLPDFYRRYKVELYCSLPCYTKENVDRQRGEGTFWKSIRALHLLNDAGYGKDQSLVLNLVYNPGGAFLPPPTQELEEDYREVLRKEHGIFLDHVITLTNMPINRFDRWLRTEGLYEQYMTLLYESFNPATLQGLMCKYYLNVGWDGRLYDCDFNQMLSFNIRDPQTGKLLTIDSVDDRSLEGMKIRTGTHCYGCTAGRGSSCKGEIVNKGT